jgi:hypothetical protein
VVDECLRPVPLDLATIFDQAVVFDYELHVLPGSDPRLAVDYIGTQIHKGLVDEQVQCNWPNGTSQDDTDKTVADAPFYLSALSSLPLDLVRPPSADLSCVNTTKYDCYVVDAAVTTRMLTLLERESQRRRRKLQTQLNITDLAVAETLDESLINIFAQPGLASGLSSIVGVTYKGLTNAPAGFVSGATSAKAKRDSMGTGALIGTIIGSILGFIILCCLCCCFWGYFTCVRNDGGDGGHQRYGDGKSQSNDRFVFSTEDEDSDERNQSKYNQDRSLLDDADDDDAEFSTSMYLAEPPLQQQQRSASPPQVWYEEDVDDDQYFSPSSVQRQRKAPTGTNILNDLMRAEEESRTATPHLNYSPSRRRHVLPDTMDL